MRILFASELYFPSIGGVQEVIRQLAERLVERGHRVSVATSYLPERRTRRLNGVDILEFKASGNLTLGLSGEVEHYRRHVLQGDYDVFVVKAAQQWTFDALLPVLCQMRKPKIFIPCGFSGLYEPAYADYFQAMPDALRRFEHLIFYATEYRDIDFARRHGLSNYSVIPNGASEREFSEPADAGFRQRHAIAADAFVVLTVGTLTGGRKGHRELAEAFELAQFGPAPAVLILNGNAIRRGWKGRTPAQWVGALIRFLGRPGAAREALALPLRLLQRALPGRLLPRFGGSGAESLQTMVARINRAAPAKRAMIVDWPRSELVQAYLNSDLFVLASQIEYSPLVLYEAAAAGLPFLSVPVGNAQEIARWTGAGVICPATRDERGYTRVDPRLLAEHLGRLAGDSSQRDALGKAGRRNWSANYTWEKITDRYEALFSRLCGQGGA